MVRQNSASASRRLLSTAARHRTTPMALDVPAVRSSRPPALQETRHSRMGRRSGDKSVSAYRDLSFRYAVIPAEGGIHLIADAVVELGPCLRRDTSGPG